MSDLTYDPDFPYVVLIREDHRPDYILGKFSDIAYAIQLKNAGIASLREIVDTTPKPKIPEDAEYITWGAHDGMPLYAARWSDGTWATSNPIAVRTENWLVSHLADAEVIVLVRKEDA